MNLSRKQSVYIGGLIVAFALGGGSVLTASWLFNFGGANSDSQNVSGPMPSNNSKQQLHSAVSDSDPNVVQTPRLTPDATVSDRLELIAEVINTDDVSLQLMDQIFENSTRDSALIEALIPLVTLKVVSAVGYDEALKQAGQIDSKFRSRAINLIYRTWAADAPFEALASLENDVSFDKDVMTRAVFASWAYHNTHDLLANLSKLPALLRASAESAAVYSLAGTSPEKATEEIHRFSGMPFEPTLVTHLVETWAQSDPEAAITWTLGAEIHPVIKDTALTKALRVIAQFDPEGAFERAQKLDQDPVFSGIALGVISKVAKNDPDLAKVMAGKINELPGWISVGRGFVEKHNWEQVLSLANSVVPENKQDYWEHVLEYWATNDPKSLFERLETLPTQAASTAALQVAIHNRWYRFLDAEALQHAVSFLSVNDSEILDKVYFEPNNRYLNISNGYGFSRTYTMDEVLAVLHRDARKEADVLPFSEY